MGEYLRRWMSAGAPGSDGGDFVRFRVPDHWLSPDLLTPKQLARVFHVDERTVRNHARRTVDVFDLCPGNGCLLLRASDGNMAPLVTPQGGWVVIASRPPTKTPGRPRGDGWRFRLVVDGEGPCTLPGSWFAVPDFVSREHSAPPTPEVLC